MAGNYNYTNFREWMYKRIDEETGNFSEEFIACVEQFMSFANSQHLTQSNGGTSYVDPTHLSGSEEVADEAHYYGILTDIIQLEYEGLIDLKITLFKCKWYDPVIGRGTRVSNGGIVDVLSSRKYYKYDPFILESQADQVCYITYPYVKKPKHLWLNVLKVNPRRLIISGESEDNDPTTLQQENDDAVLMTTVEDLEVEHLVNVRVEPINLEFDVEDAKPGDEFQCNLSSSDDDEDKDEPY
ncbi:hypothetical protein Bca4012_058482 [Brassica carinata]